VLPLARRLALIRWASERKAFIIEDDYDGELRYDCRPVEALQALDRTGRVVYLGTFSKALSPELRLGYIVVPQALLEPLLAVYWVSNISAPTLVQEVLTDFLTEGHFERHLRRLRDKNAARRRALLDAVETYLGGRVEVAGVAAGMHAVLWLPSVPVEQLPEVVSRARRLSVGVYPITSYYLGAAPRSGVLVSFASLSEDDIRDGIRLFAQALGSVPLRHSQH
jgi:GntR family transcriptional regulator/MocR family aminotransferase